MSTGPAGHSARVEVRVVEELLAVPGPIVSVYASVAAGPDPAIVGAWAAEALDGNDLGWFDAGAVTAAVAEAIEDEAAGVALFLRPERQPVSVPIAGPPSTELATFGDLAYVAPLVAAADPSSDQDALASFRSAASQGAIAEGVTETIAALASARVGLLLVHDEPADERRVVIGTGGTAIALDRGRLDPPDGPTWVVRLVDGAIRSALTMGGAVRIVTGRDRHAPAEGIGATLVT